MRKVNTYSAQFKNIENHAKPLNKSKKYNHPIAKKKLSKQNHEIINNIFANGFKQFIATG